MWSSQSARVACSEAGSCWARDRAGVAEIAITRRRAAGPSVPTDGRHPRPKECREYVGKVSHPPTIRRAFRGLLRLEHWCSSNSAQAWVPFVESQTLPNTYRRYGATLLATRLS